MFSDQQGGKRGRKYREASQNCLGREVESGHGKRGRASTDAYTGPWELVTRISSLGHGQRVCWYKFKEGLKNGRSEESRKIIDAYTVGLTVVSLYAMFY